MWLHYSRNTTLHYKHTHTHTLHTLTQIHTHTYKHTHKRYNIVFIINKLGHIVRHSLVLLCKRTLITQKILYYWSRTKVILLTITRWIDWLFSNIHWPLFHCLICKIIFAWGTYAAALNPTQKPLPQQWDG